MATNIELQIAKLEKRIAELENAGLEKHQIIHKVSREETTKVAGDLIREAYDSINTAIQKATNEGDIKAVGVLVGLKKDVPKKYAISKKSMDELNTLLNKIVQ